MTRALFRKQMMEVFSWLYKNRKSGKLRTAKGIAGYAAAYLALFGILGVVFGMAAKALCGPLLSVGMGWLYWCLMGMIAVFLGVFGSVFNTYSSLYQAKDNDLLLSMPIPVPQILLVRLSGVYAMGLLYELIVMIPAAIVWFLTAPFSAAGTFFVILIPMILSFLILVLSAFCGWIAAQAAARAKHRNIITVIASLLFFAAYYYVYGMAYSFLQMILLHAEEVGNRLKPILYPLYQMGLAAQGSVRALLIFAGITAGLTGVMYAVLEKSFLKLAISSPKTEKAVYRERSIKASSVGSALLRKEFQRFTGSAVYMLNCGLGIILMPVLAAVIVWKAEQIRSFLMMIPSDAAMLAAAGMICLLVSVNDMTAPSVSLEGKNLWIAQSLPVSGRQVLTAKRNMHLLLTLIPAIPLLAAVEWLLRPELSGAVLIPAAVILFVILTAQAGLALNLKMPNLQWSSETIPMKQSAPTVFTMFGSWGILAALAVLYAVFYEKISAVWYLLLCCVLFFFADALLFRWLMKQGSRLFHQLSN